jgi:hypothetical protein
MSNGQLSFTARMGYDPSTTVQAFSDNGEYPALEDYQMLGFLSFYHYVEQTIM